MQYVEKIKIFFIEENIFNGSILVGKIFFEYLINQKRLVVSRMIFVALPSFHPFRWFV